MDTLTVEEVSEQPTRIVHEVEKGELALVTRDGHPFYVAVPIDQKLIELGLPLVLAIRLYEKEIVSLGKAARIADVSVSEFIDRLGARGIPVARYSPVELKEELAQFG
jgi:predicted HTH domain antitoxin